MKTNPQILQAAQDREAVEFELRQARGLYLPSIDLESGLGRRRLSNATSGSLRSDSDYLSPSSASVTITQTLFDGGNRAAEVAKQASRVDGASFRVNERSEALALEVTQDYLEYILQTQIVAAAKQNVAFHNQMVGDINESMKGGALTDADRLQGRERQQAAQARLREALEELEATKIRFLKAVGEPISNPQTPPSVARSLPKTLDDAIFVAQKNSPKVYSAKADINAADAGVRGARANYMPKIDLEGTARVGNDVDGDAGNTNDAQVGVVARWNLYRGGIDVAREQEQIRRATEQRYALSQTHREVEKFRPLRLERARKPQRSRGYPYPAVHDQRPAGDVLPRPVQDRPAFASRRARRAEHALQHRCSGKDRAGRLAVCRIQDPGRLRQPAADAEVEACRSGNALCGKGIRRFGESQPGIRRA